MYRAVLCLCLVFLVRQPRHAVCLPAPSVAPDLLKIRYHWPQRKQMLERGSTPRLNTCTCGKQQARKCGAKANIEQPTVTNMSMSDSEATEKERASRLNWRTSAPSIQKSSVLALPPAQRTFDRRSDRQSQKNAQAQRRKERSATKRTTEHTDIMGRRTLAMILTLCVLTTFVSADNMATNSSTSGSGSETVAQLLADVQAAVADDPALANMFDISSASKMSEEELTTLLQELLSVSLSGSSNSSTSSSSSTTSASAEATQSASAAGSTVSSDASTVAFSTTFAVLAVAALGATL